MWTPDVYEGAPAPVTGFVATASKGAVVALLLRFFGGIGGQGQPPLWIVFAVIAIASMFLGNLLALMQKNVKRILAYSSISHMGYVLVAFLAGGNEAVTFYLVGYFAATLCAFGVISALSTGERDADDLEDYRGLFWRRPYLAAVFTAALLSLAGMPLTAGFVAKFYVLSAGAQAGLWALMIVLVINSVIGLFYYLRILGAMIARPEQNISLMRGPLPALSLAAGVVLAALALATIWIGVWPETVLRVIQKAGMG
jgi:NADH-quinone oxidoreductase subunit N